MCGFAGFTDKLDREKKTDIINLMAEKIVHRGPDSDGFFVDENIAMGFRRLSIIDLEGANQPLYYENLVLNFNGEIYNFMEIREELIKKGYKFKTTGDSEVILLGYKEYGEEIVSKLRGMFAFIIWDTEKKELFGARDYFGIKPFYYYYDSEKDLFLYASEIKSFMPHPDFKCEMNKSALKNYLVFQYSPLEQTFFNGVKKLMPATYFKYNCESGKMTLKKYFEFEYNPQKESFAKMTEELKQTLEESIKYHQISDVEVGSFLSGGVDSSFIASTMKPSKTFSVGFTQDGFDESVHAKGLSDILGIENYRQIITGDDFFDALPAVQYHSDEPHANLSAVPLYFLAKLASEQVKVVLSGEGSDELFAGYQSFIENRFEKVYKKLPLSFRRTVKRKAEKMKYFKGKTMLIKDGQTPEEHYIGQAFIMNDSEANEILKSDYKNPVKFADITAFHFSNVKNESELNKMLYLDMNVWLPHDILLKADKMTMAHSLELRVPFLDKFVWLYSAKIPCKYKVKGKSTKHIFREVAKQNIPEEWAKRKKLGFPVPFSSWLHEEKYYTEVKKTFEAEYTNIFFEKDKILNLLDEHHTKKKNNGRKIYTIFAFLVWYKQYFSV